MEAERSIMFNNPESSLNKQKKSLLEQWGPFLLASIYVGNRSMTNTEDATPYQKYFDKIPKVDHLRVIGCRWYTSPLLFVTNFNPKQKNAGLSDTAKLQKRGCSGTTKQEKLLSAEMQSSLRRKYTVETQTNSKAAQL